MYGMQILTKFIARLQITLGVLLLVIFLASTLTQVVTRYLGISVLWTEEVAVNSFIWAMFLGAAVMVRENKHFGFDVLTHYFKGTKRSILVIFQNLIMLIFCLLCSLYSVEITQAFWHSRWISIPEFRQGYVWLIMPITFISSSVYLLDNIYNEAKTLSCFKGASWNLR
ncbi:TRAP transporter small permease [Marinomonas primoryensis]